MSPSRNDPCPCGSGRKYKACHMRADEIAARTEQMLGDEAVAFAQAKAAGAARQASVWEADVAPLMGPFEDTGEAGAVVMVAAGGLILVADTLARRAVGAQARARAVLDAVSTGARQAGVYPARLHVRDEALADALRADAEARGMTVAAAPLAELDEALDDSLAHLMESAAGGATSRPWTWAETEASPAALAELHAAAAAFHRAAPWRTMSDSEVLLLRFPGDDAPWAASVMGGGGIHIGLALYSVPEDLAALMDSGGEGNPDERIAAMRGITLSLSYARAADVPRAMRREVTSAGWEVAGPDAHLSLFGIRIPGRRITAELVRRTSMACRAVTAFARVDDVPLPWVDPATGMEVDFMFDDDDEDGPDLIPPPWPPLEVSHPVGPEGAGADPHLVLRHDRQGVAAGETARFERLVAWIEGGKPSQAAVTRLVRTAEMWTDMLVGFGMPAESVTEYDLRLFLYNRVPNDWPPKPVAKHLTRSLARIFAFYAEHEGIEYPWAPSVLHELDVLAAGADDVRTVLDAAKDAFQMDIIMRALRPMAMVPGTQAGWTMLFDTQSAVLRNQLHRQWLLWHDEVVRGGITSTDDVRDVLTGRQREWENTPQATLGGRTPKQALLDAERKAVEGLDAEG